MKKIFLFMMVSLDGFFEGENHDLSWHRVDEEFNRFAVEQTSRVGTLLFGKRTYEMMAEFWPSETARKTDPETARLMNIKPKVVFSTTLKEVKETEYWKNAQLVKNNASDFIRTLKSRPGDDIAIYGSNKLCVSLMEEGLVDEFHIMVNPVAIGKGTPLFYGIKEKAEFALSKTRQFKNGNVLLLLNRR